MSKQENPLSDQEQRVLGLCITENLEAERLFKLYSFRIISPRQFIEEMQLIAEKLLETKKLDKSNSNGQLDLEDAINEIENQ